MASFRGLFDFPDDLSEGQSELSSPSDSSDKEYSDENSEDKNEWYNLPSDSSDEENNTVAPIVTLLIHLPTLTSFVISSVIRKEHSTGARIKAIYMLEEKKSSAII
jgi:hypothetical protein